tara:strand:+ start:218 stop:448 length:231 start_codon:yes stop_codon:yes gene_type:complete
MKNLKIVFALAIFTAFISCNEKTKKDYHEEHGNFKVEIEQMKTKLEATEAQLLNISAELSELKNELKNDSSIVMNE